MGPSILETRPNNKASFPGSPEREIYIRIFSRDHDVIEIGPEFARVIQPTFAFNMYDVCFFFLLLTNFLNKQPAVIEEQKGQRNTKQCLQYGKFWR